MKKEHETKLLELLGKQNLKEATILFDEEQNIKLVKLKCKNKD